MSSVETTSTKRRVQQASTSGARLWRVFYTRARSEKKCETRLEERRINVLLPKRAVKRQWSDRVKRVVEPLFRNYIFAKVNEKERLRVLRTRGIVRCVTFRGEPARLREEEAEQLRRSQQAPDRLEAVDLRPEIGTPVVVTDGPLQGLTGRVLEHRGRAHVFIRVESVQQSVKVEIAAGNLEERPDASTAETRNR